MAEARIVYTRPDGGVNVVRPAVAFLARFPTEQAAIEALMTLDVPGGALYESLAIRRPARKAWMMTATPKGLGLSAADAETRLDAEAATAQVSVQVCTRADLPARRWFNCWRQAGAAVPHVDLPLARLQRMAEIRVERDRQLAASDGPMLRVQERGTPAQVAALLAYRQALRDLPQTIDLSVVATPEALAAFEPTWPVEPT